MNRLDQHPVLGQLTETQRRLTNVDQIQAALAERRRLLERDGKITTVVSGIIGISGLFFMQTLPFYLVLTLLVVGLPLIWRHLVKEARELAMSDDEIEQVLKVESRK
ncbi:MAG: hypothetical protein HQ507_07935 [Candidatus Marinimicrobia bacterium]|nr:hypothetical protein [Candidatus Neomarinimicrobiota bacterium]